MNTVSVYTAPTKTLFAVSFSNSGFNGNLNKLTRVLTLGHSETQNFKYLKKNGEYTMDVDKFTMG